ncbi:MAG: signal peptide peptidase SppA [Acidobacteria bacterium]|nr:signal peptide peptidase SppA [Acidobacteriota bacterium]
MTRRAKKWLIWLGIIIVIIIVISVSGRLPANSILVLELNDTLEEQKAGGVLAALFEAPPTVMHEVQDAILTAGDDDRIKGLVLKITSPGSGWAKLQELRGTIGVFRKSGKPTICYLNGDTPANHDYYLATACDQVWMVPTATLGITGLMVQSTFYRGTFEKLGIYPDMYGFYEYKTARDQYTEKKYTAANKEMVTSLMTSIYNQYVTDVVKSRKFEREKFEELVKKGPYLTSEAVSEKLIDKAAYWDEVQDYFKKKSGEWKPVALSRYSREVRNLGLDKIAVVHATGIILVGKSDYSPSAGFVMGSESVAADLRAARQDSSVKAIILRVDSPGGSAVASEIIRREVQLADKVKPVIVSMSDVAGSGGYWISMSGRKILADPSTLTASIGVVYGKLNVSGLYNLLGLSTDSVQTSENAGLNDTQHNFTPAQKEIVIKSMQSIYDNFTKGVAEGRKLKLEEVLKIAKGRVWTGEQAKGLGLIDEIGGFDRALALARSEAKLDALAKIQVVRYPEEKPWWAELLGKEDSQNVRSLALGAELRRIMNRTQAVETRMPVEIKIQ